MNRLFLFGVAISAIFATATAIPHDHELIALKKNVPFKGNVTEGFPVGYIFQTEGNETHISVRVARCITFALS